MFLKSELLESNGSSVTLFQLSALQRIEYLEYLKQLEAVEAGDFQAAITLTVKSGAFLVAMSLWHGHELKGSQGENAAAEVAKIQDEVMQSWPTGMIAPVIEEPTSSGEERNDPAEPVTAEKSSPVS